MDWWSHLCLTDFPADDLRQSIQNALRRHHNFANGVPDDTPHDLNDDRSSVRHPYPTLLDCSPRKSRRRKRRKKDHDYRSLPPLIINRLSTFGWSPVYECDFTKKNRESWKLHESRSEIKIRKIKSHNKRTDMRIWDCNMRKLELNKVIAERFDNELRTKLAMAELRRKKSSGGRSSTHKPDLKQDIGRFLPGGSGPGMKKRSNLIEESQWLSR